MSEQICFRDRRTKLSQQFFAGQNETVNKPSTVIFETYFILCRAWSQIRRRWKGSLQLFVRDTAALAVAMETFVRGRRSKISAHPPSWRPVHGASPLPFVPHDGSRRYLSSLGARRKWEAGRSHQLGSWSCQISDLPGYWVFILVGRLVECEIHLFSFLGGAPSAGNDLFGLLRSPDLSWHVGWPSAGFVCRLTDRSQLVG